MSAHPSLSSSSSSAPDPGSRPRRRRPVGPGRFRASRPNPLLGLLRLLVRIPVRYTLAALLLAVLVLPSVSPQWGKDALSRLTPRANAAPTASGAEAAYPLNHSLDTTGGTVGTPPANHDFETAPTSVGTPPTNHDFATGPSTVGTPPTNHTFQTAPTSVGTPPTNHDFEADLTGWTTTGSPTIQTDAAHGKYVKLISSAAVTSSAFTVDSTAQVLSFDLGFLAASGTNSVRVYALTGASYTTSTTLATVSCGTCGGSWRSVLLDATAYAGQSIKLKFERVLGEVGVDLVRAQVVASGWTVAGNLSRETEAGGNVFLGLDANGELTTAAFTVDATAQVVSLRVKGLSANSDQYKLFLLSGAGFATSTQLAYTTADDTWTTLRYNLTAYAGQQVKLKVERFTNAIGVDDVGVQTLEVAGWTATGTPTVASDATQTNYVSLGTSASLTSAAFTVDSAAQVVALKVKGLSGGSDQYKVSVLSGAAFATATEVLAGYGPASWSTVTFNPASWAGQQIKLKVERVFSGTIGFDEVGVGQTVVPGWTVSDTVTRETGGPSGAYARTNGTLTSAAFTLPATVQQLSVAYKGEGSGAQFYLELLRGANFDQVVDLGGGPIVGDQTQWKTHKAGVQAYAGETVKLRLRRYLLGWMLFDTTGVMEQLLPGWTLVGIAGVAVGEDTNGSYATAHLSGKEVQLKSSLIQSGVIDRPSGPDFRYFAVSYDIGTQTASTLSVRWSNTTGQSWVAASDASDTPTGVRTKYFYVADFMGQVGQFQVEVKGGKVYSIADNVARQQLAEPFSQKVGIQVDTSTGSFGYAAQDLATQGALPLVFARYYSGHSDRLGTLGYRWSHSYDTRLTLAANGDAGVVFGNGSEAFFRWSSGTSTFSAADPRVKDSLVKNGDGTYTFTTTSNLKYLFTSAGALTSIKDLNNNTLALTYNGNGRLTTVTRPGNQTLTLAYNANGRISTVTDPTNAVVTFGYNASGDLITATDPLNKTETYSYNQHRLTNVVDKAHNTLFTNTLDATHRVTQQTDAQSNTLTLAYDTPAKGATRVTNPTNNATTYYFDAFHRTTDVEDPTGKVYSSVYDANGNLFKSIDPAGNQTQVTYDAGGNPLTVQDPLNQSLQMTWNAQHQPLTVRDKRGNVTTLVYDAAGNVTQTTDALGKVWTATYDARGNVLTETNPLGQTTTHTYDTANHRLSTTDALNHTWTWTYDAVGRVLTATNPLNQTTTYTYSALGQLLTATNPLNQTTTYTYTAWGDLTSVVDPLGNTTTYTYNSLGLNASRTDPAGKVTTYTWDAARRLASKTDPLNRTTTYTYDAAGRLATLTDPAGGVTTYTYDTAGRLATKKDPLNRTTTFAYNTAGQVTSITAPNGGVTVFTYDADGNRLTERDALLHTTTYEYDALSHLKKVTDAAGGITTYSYDNAGRQTGVTDPLNRTTTTTYDSAGRRTGTTNPLNQTTNYSYDNANRLLSITDALSRTTTYAYDAADRRTTVTDPANNTTTTTYDAAGRVTRVTRPSGAYTASTYDPRGLLLTTSNNLGHTTTYAYDNAGQMTSMTDPLNRATTYGYDAAGRQTTMTDALNGTVTTTYDGAGQRTAVTNARGKITTYTYNSLGNVLTETDPLNRTTTYAYNTLGLPIQVTDPRGVVVQMGYDAVNRPTSISYPGGSVSHTYDAASQRTGMTDASGTTTWTYDGAGRVASVVAPQGTVSYTYNAAGQRTSMTLPVARTVTYGYDPQGRMTSLTDWANRVIGFGYNADGQRTTTTRPGGLTSANTYDAAGRLTGVTHTGPGGTLKSFTYTLDAAGNRTGVTGSGGTESYALDALGRITGVTYPNGDTSTYTYDANGNRLSWTRTGTNAGTTNYTYDNADQLLTEGSVTYSYDNAGNVTARGGDSFTWDWNNRLTSATVGGTATTYAFDGDGVRTGKTQGGTTVNYLWDRESGLPLLVDDGTTSYVHAGGLQEQVTNSSGTARSLLTDALGSVRGAADTAGTLTGTADYDVFGEVRGTSTTGSGLGFTGEQHDAETGFTFLRSRSYHPGSGRFLSADTVQPNAPGTQGYNRYAYTANNPTTWTDPSGHSVAQMTEAESTVLFMLAGGAIVIAVPLAVLLASPQVIVAAVLWTACLAWPTCRDIVTNAAKWLAEGGLRAIAGGASIAWALISCVLNKDCLTINLTRVAGGITTSLANCAQNNPAAPPELDRPCIPQQDPCSQPGNWSVSLDKGGKPCKPEDKDCLPDGRTGNRSIYVGTDNSGERQGQVTYVGETGATMRDREDGHQHNPDPGLRKDITLHPLALRAYSQWLAWAIEKYLYLQMKGAGYKMTNNPLVLRPAESNRCYAYLMRVAAEVVQQDGLWEKIQQVAPPPGGAP